MPVQAIWMVSPAFDLMFFVGSAVVVLGPWLAIEHFHVSAIVVIAAVAIVSNGPHLASTWTRVYLDGNERWKRPIAYWLVPLLLGALVVGLVLTQGRASRPLRTLLFYWAFWHFISQNWGILRIYQRRAGEADLPIAKLERVVLWLGALWPWSHRIFTGPWQLFGAEIYHPTLEPWMVNGLGAALAAAALLYLGIRVGQAIFGHKVDIIRPLFLAASWFAFLVPFVLIKRSGSAAFAAAALWHGLQYLGIVWFYNRGKWRAGVDGRARLVSWISQPGRAPLYFLALLGIVGLFYGLLNVAALFVWDVKVWAAITWISLTFGHYWLDGVIWKLRRPELRKHLVDAWQPAPGVAAPPR